jgi:tetratricopeptide (TPR) repeat protein
MAQNSQNYEDLTKAKVFFERAEEVAATGNFDYAIDMYLEGLRRAPNAVEEGYMPLRQMALLRQSRGGKKPSMMDKIRRSRSKDALEEMLNNVWLWAREPDNTAYCEAIMKAASAGGFKRTAEWMADVVFDAAASNPKQSFQTFVLLKETYSAARQWEKAIKALQYAIRLKPSELALADELRNLSAELAVKKGKYDQEGDFRQSLQDKERQDKLQAQDAVVKPKNYRVSALNAAREAYANDSTAVDAIFRLAEALSDMETEETYEEAYELLERNYLERQDFNFRRRAGELKIKHLGRMLRAAKAALEAGGQNAEAKAAFEKIHTELAVAEIEHYRLCVENYPTDARMKYEYGMRLMRGKQFDEAIPLFQEAQRDPRLKIAAMNNTGLCFFLKGWHNDSVDIFRRAIDAYEIMDDAIAKELRYNLARAFEEQGNSEEALEIYRKLAQMDFGFKDVRQRVDKLRKQG